MNTFEPFFEANSEGLSLILGSLETIGTAADAILALDLGKYKSVACIYRSADDKQFTTIATSRAHLTQLFFRDQPAVVLIEACLLCGWVARLVLGVRRPMPGGQHHERGLEVQALMRTVPIWRRTGTRAGQEVWRSREVAAAPRRFRRRR